MAEHAHTTPTLTSPRRRIAAAVTSAIAVVTIGRSQSDDAQLDAELLAVCAAAEAADEKCQAAYRECQALAQHDPLRAAAGKRCDEFNEMFCAELDRAQAIPARTLNGFRAKAKLAIRNVSTTDEDPDGFNPSFLRELAGSA